MTNERLEQLRRFVLEAIDNNTTLDARGMLVVNIPTKNIGALNAIHDMVIRELRFRWCEGTDASGGAA